MAFNWQTFKTRSLTAVVFVVVMMTGLLLNAWSYFILFTLIHFGAWIEYQQLVKKMRRIFLRIHQVVKRYLVQKIV